MHGERGLVWPAGPPPAPWRSGRMAHSTGNVPGMLHLGSLSLTPRLSVPCPCCCFGSRPSSRQSRPWPYLYPHRPPLFRSDCSDGPPLISARLPIPHLMARVGRTPAEALIDAMWRAASAPCRLLGCSPRATSLRANTNPSPAFLPLPHASGASDMRAGAGSGGNQARFTRGLTLFLAILLGIAISPGATHYVSCAGELGRLVDLDGWARFALLFCRLLSGDTIYVWSARAWRARLVNGPTWQSAPSWPAPLAPRFSCSAAAIGHGGNNRWMARQPDPSLPRCRLGARTRA